VSRLIRESEDLSECIYAMDSYGQDYCTKKRGYQGIPDHFNDPGFFYLMVVQLLRR